MGKLTDIIFIIVVLISFRASAQQPQQPKKEVYISKDGKYYINKALPIFMNFTTSKDAGAKSYPLSNSQDPASSRPFHFVTEGHNPIKIGAVKSGVASKVLYLDVYVDGKPPITKTEFSGAHKEEALNKKIYGQGLQISLEAKDEISGVKTIFYSINKAAYQKYDKELTFSKDGDYSISYYATDNVGNMEKPRQIEFNIDMTPPKTEYKIIGTNNNNILSEDSKIELISKDKMSGVFQTMYSIDNKPFETFIKPIRLSSLKDGNHEIRYYSIDRVKNNEDKKQAGNAYKFYLDKFPPTIKISLQGKEFVSPSGTRFIPAATKINIEAKDNHSGIKTLTYEIRQVGQSSESSPRKPYSAPFTIATKGPKEIIARATDNVNHSNLKSFKVYMDNVAPNTGIKIGRPQFFNGDRSLLCVTSKTMISFFASVAHSGVKKTAYKIDGGAEVVYKTPVNITKEGKHKISYWSVDNVDNAEKPLSITLLVDNTPPSVKIRFSSPGVDKTIGGKSMKSYPIKSRMYIDATDEISGVESVRFSVNDEDKILNYSQVPDYHMKEIFSIEKVYKIKVYVTDKLKNTDVKIFEFFIHK